MAACGRSSSSEPSTASSFSWSASGCLPLSTKISRTSQSRRRTRWESTRRIAIFSACLGASPETGMGRVADDCRDSVLHPDRDLRGGQLPAFHLHSCAGGQRLDRLVSGPPPDSIVIIQSGTAGGEPFTRYHRVSHPSV